MAKRENPYQRLLNEFRGYLFSVRFPKRKNMYFFPKYKLKNSNWDLMSAWERTCAAQDLGKEVIVEAAEDGLRFNYRDKPDEGRLPWTLRSLDD